MHQILLYDQMVAARSPIPLKTTKIASDHRTMVGNLLKTTENFEVAGGSPQCDWPIIKLQYINRQGKTKHLTSVLCLLRTG